MSDLRVSVARPSELRLPAVDVPEPSTASILDNTVFGDDGKPLPIFLVLAHHERILRRFNSFGALLRTSTVTTLAHREVMVLRTAWRCDCTFEFDQHLPIARDAGVSSDTIAAARDQGPPPEDPVDRLLLALTDEMIDLDSVTSPTWTAACERWTPAQVLELLMTVGFFRMAAVVINSVGLRPSPNW